MNITLSARRSIQRAQPNVAELIAKIDELEETVRQLRVALTPQTPMPQILRLTNKEQQIVALLYKRSPKLMSNEAIFVALYAAKIDAPCNNIVSNYICKIRAKLKPFDLKIEICWGLGYLMSAASALALRGMIETEAAVPGAA